MEDWLKEALSEMSKDQLAIILYLIAVGTRRNRGKSEKMVVFVVEIEYTVKCDVCGEFTFGSVFLPREMATIKNAKKEFEEWGWTFKGSRAICPECRKRTGRAKE